MIRRSLSTDSQGPQGPEAQSPERWLLISQVEHARLSGVLAEAWDSRRLTPVADRDEMLAAITHHDDGWSAWEVAPKVDAQSGRPLDFTETPLTDSLAIWRESIRRAVHFGPLAAYMVSGHFSALLERFSARWRSDASLARLAEGYLEEQRDARGGWLRERQKSASEEAVRDDADCAVAWLQMFDAISLWLCCAERDEPQSFCPPDGSPVSLQPGMSPYEIEMVPWPLSETTLTLEALGRSIAAAHYANSSDLVTAPAEPFALRWSFRPAAD